MQQGPTFAASVLNNTRTINAGLQGAAMKHKDGACSYKEYWSFLYNLVLTVRYFSLVLTMIFSVQQSAKARPAQSGQPVIGAPDGMARPARALALLPMLAAAGFTMERRPPN